MSLILPSRRTLVTGAAALLGGALVTGCDRLSSAPRFREFLGGAEGLTMAAQRALLAGQPLAREFRPDQISRSFRANGTTAPDTPEYAALLERNFASYHLHIGGMVSQPLSFSLDQLRQMTARTQITRHDCVEGWSAIGGWKGAPLHTVLSAVQLKPEARFIVFHCADNLGGGPGGRYYESIDLFDAFHPQTILAYELNGAPLDVAHGAPLRLRVERQLGYKHAKYILRIEAVDRLDGIGRGKGGYWEDRGYQWYAGI